MSERETEDHRPRSCAGAEHGGAQAPRGPDETPIGQARGSSEEGVWRGGRLMLEACLACGGVWLMRRGFCPRCGHVPVVDRPAVGDGVVHALTRVLRAPSQALQAQAPFTIVLVDLAEGVRLMAHAPSGLQIGDAVRIVPGRFDGRTIPVCQPA